MIKPPCPVAFSFIGRSVYAALDSCRNLSINSIFISVVKFMPLDLAKRCASAFRLGSNTIRTGAVAFSVSIISISLCCLSHPYYTHNMHKSSKYTFTGKNTHLYTLCILQLHENKQENTQNTHNTHFLMKSFWQNMPFL